MNAYKLRSSQWETQVCTHVNGNSCSHLTENFPACGTGSSAGYRACATPLMGTLLFVQPLFGGMVPSRVDGEAGNKGNAVQWVVPHGQCFLKEQVMKITKGKSLKWEDQTFRLSGSCLFLWSHPVLIKHIQISYTLRKHLDCLRPTVFSMVFPHAQIKREFTKCISSAAC